MSTLREAAQQALDDLRDLHANHNITYAGTISRLEAALAQEPQTTHSAACWRWHHRCAVAKIERECKHD